MEILRSSRTKLPILGTKLPILGRQFQNERTVRYQTQKMKIPMLCTDVQRISSQNPRRNTRAIVPVANLSPAPGSSCEAPHGQPVIASLCSESQVGPPGANDRFFTVRKNSGRISSCLPYHTAFKNKRIREPSPARVGIRWNISSPLCPPSPRFPSL